MDIEITDNEEAQSEIDGIREDLSHIDRATQDDKVTTLKDIKNTITELIDYYNKQGWQIIPVMIYCIYFVREGE